MQGSFLLWFLLQELRKRHLVSLRVSQLMWGLFCDFETNLLNVILNAGRCKQALRPLFLCCTFAFFLKAAT